MKVRTLTRAVLVAMALAPCAGAASLEPSLRPFARVAAPMPDFRDVTYYQTLPTADGTFVPRLLSAGTVRWWFLDLARTQPGWSDLREKLDIHLDVYKDTVDEEGGQLMAVTNATTAEALIAFNGEQHGQVMSLLNAYRGLMSQVVIANTARAAAHDEVEAAMQEAAAVASSVREKESEEELAKLATERDAIQEKAKNAGWVHGVVNEFLAVSKAIKSPEALAGYLGEKTVGMIDTLLTQSVLNAEWEHLTAIADREEELRKVVAEARTKGREAEVAASQARLAAARKRLIQRSLERTALFVEAWVRLDELAALERSSKSTTLFVALQAYNDHIHTMGLTVRNGGIAYLYRLDHMPSAVTDRLLAQMTADITDVQDRHDERFAEWLEVALGTREYVFAHRTWYLTEHKQVEQQIAAFEAGDHLELVRATVNDALAKLGSTLGQ